MYPHHPVLPVAPADLHPTQLTVGYAEVTAKRAEWEQLGKKKRRQLLERHWFPGVLGPKRDAYIVDHHHLGLALLEEGVQSVPVMVLRDFSYLSPTEFWRAMEFYHWAHPYDAANQRRDYSAFPRSLPELQNDPYRSLAARVQSAGGYAKDAIPYAEFMWAGFLRERLKLRKDETPSAKLVARAVTLAHSSEAGYLPGWSGEV
ncbi:MAG TPA: ParB-like protein [Rhodanobacter sp.]